MRSKYGARKVMVDGMRFDSQKEARRWLELRLLERAGEISDLQRQVRFELIPAQRDGAGRLMERACYYIADFSYNEAGNKVVEDAKGVRTPEYIIKRKLMLYRHGIAVREV